MKAFILNGFEKKDDTLYKIISEHLKGIGWEINTFFPQDKRIAPCQGCFGCWIKTPGICVIDDDGRDIVQMAIQSDMIVFLSPITFGGYSSGLKKAIDRMVPIALPFFMKIDGEIHHKSRYGGRPLEKLGFFSKKERKSLDLITELLTTGRKNSQEVMDLKTNRPMPAWMYVMGGTIFNWRYKARKNKVWKRVYDRPYQS